MIYIDLPTGEHHGWGVVGDELSRALGKVAAVQRLDKDAPLQGLEPGPLLQSIGASLHPHRPQFQGRPRVGYVVFEDDLMARRCAARLLDGFDSIAAASRWATQALRDGGLTNVVTIHHGVDVEQFNPGSLVQRRSDRFVIFSGGKFELRKGQDIVVKAFNIFSQRHADVFLMTAWHNAIPASAATMSASPYSRISFNQSLSFADGVKSWLTGHGIDLSRTTVLPFTPRRELPAIYRATDIGLFPNRCEGATNLVLMEYLACGRSVVATDFSGHRDVLTSGNSLRLCGSRCSFVGPTGAPVARWCEPSLDEILEYLELAYRDRDRLAELGIRAACDMKEWTWDRSAKQFLFALSESCVVRE